MTLDDALRAFGSHIGCWNRGATRTLDDAAGLGSEGGETRIAWGPYWGSSFMMEGFMIDGGGWEGEGGHPHSIFINST
jgi:hypothetical protein